MKNKVIDSKGGAAKSGTAEALNGRSGEVLRCVLREYSKTGEPVSSKRIAARYSLGISPATVRSIMSDLETAALLSQPYTSAGRVPTEAAYRLYVDTMLELEEVSEKEARSVIDEELLSHTGHGGLIDRSAEEVMRETAKRLTLLTGCTSLLLAPHKNLFTIKHIELIPALPSHLTVILMSTDGEIIKRKVEVTEELKSFDLTKIAKYLNSIAKSLTIEELKRRLTLEIQGEKNRYDRLLREALRLGSEALRATATPTTDDIYIDGTENLLDMYGGGDGLPSRGGGDIELSKIKNLLRALQEKSLLLWILNECTSSGEVNIRVGSESHVEAFEDLSFVLAPYRQGSEVVGALGVIGPMRMNYSKIIPLVDYTAGLIGRVL